MAIPAFRASSEELGGQRMGFEHRRDAPKSHFGAQVLIPRLPITSPPPCQYTHAGMGPDGAGVGR